jgi:hypothetical protein
VSRLQATALAMQPKLQAQHTGLNNRCCAALKRQMDC